MLIKVVFEELIINEEIIICSLYTRSTRVTSSMGIYGGKDINLNILFGMHKPRRFLYSL